MNGETHYTLKNNMERIYDIGANKGAFTKANMNKFPLADFVLVEANPTLCEVLANEFKANNNVKIINRCVSNVDNEDIVFYISNHDTLSTASTSWVNNSRFTSMNSYHGKISVPSITIDSLIKEHGEPSYIKLDVEGYELTALKGMNKNNGLISFEWAEESKNEIIQSIEHLCNIGYTMFNIMETDNYTALPSIFSNRTQILDYINTNLIETRMSKWGMIFGK